MCRSLALAMALVPLSALANGGPVAWSDPATLHSWSTVFFSFATPTLEGVCPAT
jgi:hypothetical protein